MQKNNMPFPYMDKYLTKFYKTGCKPEDAMIHYAYTRTLIEMLNKSKLFSLIPDVMKKNIVKLIASYFSTSELIKLALKKKEQRGKI